MPLDYHSKKQISHHEVKFRAYCLLRNIKSFIFVQIIYCQLIVSMKTHLSNKQLFLSFVGQTSAFPMAVEVARAEGIYLFSPEGKKYIDLISGIAVSSLGHNHPRLVRAVKEQADKHMHVMVYGEFVQSPQAQLANAISETLPKKLDNVFFVNSGSEAIEGAMKLAKRYTGRNKIVSCNKAYHGATHGRCR
jgi:putrescine aminotransferase